MSNESAIQECRVQVCARDQYPLSGTHYWRSDREASAGVVLMSSANAVPQKFYREFARFFAGCGYDVYTYDYRGIGLSAPATLKGFDASVHTWALQDIPALIDYVGRQHPGHDLTYFAHSIGGQLLGLADNADQIDRAVFVSSQFGYWKMQGGRQKYVVGAFTHLVFPVLPRLIGYLPWSKFAAGEDLPKGVALQWARWCRAKNYLFDDQTLGDLSGYKNLKKPLLAYCISDDDWGTSQAVRGMTERYSGAKIEYRDVSPSEFGFQSLGHFGFFKRGRESLWEDALGWMRNTLT